MPSSAFSLLELMIAIVILGIGLIMVAAMFPIAWNRARDLAEFTTQQTLTSTAEEMCKMLLRVDSDKTEVGSFAGDLDFHTPSGASDFIACRDSRVHLLHMQNLSAASYQYVPAPPRKGNPDPPTAAPWRIEGLSQSGGGFTYDPQLNLPWPDDPFFTRGFGAAQIRFEQRVYPPIEPRDPTTLDPNTGQPDPTKFDTVWEGNIDARRYAFAVFHKLNSPTEPIDCTPPGPTAQQLQEGLAEEREFTMYYVTLRRTRPTLRFAVQDPANVPDPGFPNNPVQVAALPAANDVLLPEPWRVQIYFEPAQNPAAPVGFEIHGSDLNKPPKNPPEYSEGTGLPSVAQINHPNHATGPLALDFFERGTVFIDERNGGIYTVADVRRSGSGQTERGFLTLEQEVVVKDLDDGVASGLNGLLDLDEALRTVWVFPPPVERESDGTAVFTGGSPVVGIDTKPLTVSPQR